MNYTKEQVQFNIATDQKWLEGAICAIYKYQTLEEKREGETKFNNGVGFNGADARKLSYYANWLEGGKHLSGKHLADARRRMGKYAGQILKLIELKSKQKRRVA